MTTRTWVSQCAMGTNVTHSLTFCFNTGQLFQYDASSGEKVKETKEESTDYDYGYMGNIFNLAVSIFR